MPTVTVDLGHVWSRVLKLWRSLKDREQGWLTASVMVYIRASQDGACAGVDGVNWFKI